MGVKWKTVKDVTPKMQAAAKKLNGKQVEVGAFKGEHAWLVGIHEYGCTIIVTPKMEAYLHHIGIHLHPAKHEIVIPERSFLRAGFDENHAKVMDMHANMLAKVLGGEYDPKTFLGDLGEDLAEAIRTYAENLSSPPLVPWPGRKGGNPLNDTGQMIASIDKRIK